MFSNVWLELNICKTVVIKQEMYCFNMRIPYMHFFFSIFNIIREKIGI